MSEKRPNELIVRWKRIGLMVVAFVIAVLGIAWFHGGEEPLRMIIEPVAVPEDTQ